MKQQIKVPSAGESVTQATIGEWQKKDGDYVQQNDVLVVMETDKASMDLVAEHSGVLKILKPEGEDVAIGTVIGELDTAAAAPKEAVVSVPSSSADKKEAPNLEEKREASEKKTAVPKPASNAPVFNQSSPLAAAKRSGPAAKKLIAEHNIKSSQVQATGPGGRITKGDVLAFLQNPSPPPPSQPDSSPRKQTVDFEQRTTQTGQMRERMSTLRRRIAERLVESQHSTATLTTFNEIDMSKVMTLRAEHKEAFQKKHDIKLGFMGFFIKAVVKALQTFPKVNAFIEDREIVYNQGCHIGVAVSTERGLVVPVIKNAEQLSLPDLEKAVLFYAVKARDGKISPDDLMGGTFTISNGGVFGSLMSTPILNPPQSGILGMHKIEQRPIAVDGQIKIKPMMYAALSYDHRMVDGRESVGFLLKVKECVEDPIRLLMDV